MELIPKSAQSIQAKFPQGETCMSLVADPQSINQPNPFEQLVHLLKARVADLQQQADSNPDSL
jgi:hypothetical protein